METPILFEEVQATGNDGLRRVLQVLAVLFAAALLLNIVLQKGEANVLTHVLLTLSLACLLASLFMTFKLITQIRSDGIYVRYPPIRFVFARFAWTDVRQVYVREYGAGEYGGWGIRISPSGWGYIVPGNMGIQLVMADGSRVLITTHRPDEVREVLRKLGHHSKGMHNG